MSTTTCPDCRGDGTLEVSDRDRCKVRDCCGGCAHHERCATCDGTGLVESDDDNDEDGVTVHAPGMTGERDSCRAAYRRD